MIFHLALLINLCLAVRAQTTHEDIVTEYEMSVSSICGNIEFNVNFMHTEIYISDPYKIDNITIQDATDDKDNLILSLGDKGGYEPLHVKVPICARRLMLEVCNLEAQEDLTVKVVQHQKLCYMSDADYESHTVLTEEALTCAKTDFIKCRKNEVSSCKFIDCLRTHKTSDIDMDSKYLFSACLPVTFENQRITQVCKVVADGNDYKDYLLDTGEPAITRVKWVHMHVWLTIMIVIASIMCAICTCSCYYNWKIFRTQEQPFPVPPCCPECLFPRQDQHNILLLQQAQNWEDSIDSSHNDPRVTPLGIELPKTTPGQNRQDKYEVPRISLDYD